VQKINIHNSTASNSNEKVAIKTDQSNETFSCEPKQADTIHSYPEKSL
jgi:hypothetical protein